MWEPTRRIRNARQKIGWFSPVALLVDNLKQNPAMDKFNSPGFLEWPLPLLVQVLVAGPLHHPPLLTSQNMTSTTKSWVDQ